MLNKFIRDKQSPEVIKQARAMPEGKKFSFPDAAKDPQTKRQFIEIFLRDVSRSITVLDAFVEKSGTHSKEETRSYIIHTHGIKSALENIGKTDISAIASKLEKLGRDNNIEAMKSETPAFLSLLKTLVNEITPKEEAAGEQVAHEDKQYLTDMLFKIKAACEEYNESTVGEKLAELKKTTWSQETKELFNKIEQQLLHSDFDEITADINKILDTVNRS
jgi:HPt (histidine-containing phosphotransfer) domain-containing protein